MSLWTNLHRATGIADADPPGMLDFELSVDRDGTRELGSYGGLTWIHAGVINGHQRYDVEAPDCGYITGITSGEEVAYNRNAKVMTFYSAGGSFDVEQMQLTAAWSKQLTVKITGFLDGEEKYETSVKVTDLGPLLVTLHWEDVDAVRMKPTKQVVDPDQPHSGRHFAMDDLVITNLTPDAPSAQPSLSHAFADDSIAQVHDTLAFSAGQHVLTAITALV